MGSDTDSAEPHSQPVGWVARAVFSSHFPSQLTAYLLRRFQDARILLAHFEDS